MSGVLELVRTRRLIESVKRADPQTGMAIMVGSTVALAVETGVPRAELLRAIDENYAQFERDIQPDNIEEQRA